MYYLIILYHSEYKNTNTSIKINCTFFQKIIKNVLTDIFIYDIIWVVKEVKGMYIVGLINKQGTKVEFDFNTIQGALDFIEVSYKLIPDIRRTLKYVLLH